MFLARDLNRKVTSEQFPYYRCMKCGVVFLDPIPEDLGRYYPEGYHAIPVSLEALMQGREHEEYKLDAIGRYGSGRRLLEIGPSYGGFLALAREAGFDASAIELDPACSRFLRETLGVQVLETGDILRGLRELGSFDVITLWHSLEHLPDPWALLDVLPRHLKAGGLLAIASPNPGSIQFRVFGRYWLHLDAPRHVHLIPPAAVENRLKPAMRRIHFSTKDRGAIDCNYVGWKFSPPHMFPTWMFSGLFIWAGLKVRGRLVPIENRQPYGSAYTLVFQRA